MQGVEAQAVTEKSTQEVLEANLGQLVLPMTDQIDIQALAKTVLLPRAGSENDHLERQ